MTTRCDFSVRSAWDEMRHIMGCSEPDVIILSDKDQNRECRKKDKFHMEFLCELYEAQVARIRCFVHELTSEVNSRMQWRDGHAWNESNWRIGACLDWSHAMNEDQDLSKQVYGRASMRL